MSHPARKKDGDLLGPGDVISGLHELPSAASVLGKLLKTVSDSSASVLEVVDLVKIEPGTAARVLQMANSAYYSSGKRCTNLDEAVNRIGMIKISELAMLAVSSQVLMRGLSTYGIEADELWRKSVECAISSEILAQRCEFELPAAYVTGLFHAVGLVAIDSWMRTEEEPVTLASTGWPHETTEAEKKHLGFTNAAVADALLRSWSFLSGTCAAVRWQYAPLSAGSECRAACLLHAAKWLRIAAFAPKGAVPPPPPPAPILNMLRLKKDDLEGRFDEVREAFAQAAQLLADD